MLLLNPSKDFVIEPSPGSGVSTALAIYALNKVEPEKKYTQILWIAVNIEAALQMYKLLRKFCWNSNVVIKTTVSSDGCKSSPLKIVFQFININNIITYVYKNVNIFQLSSSRKMLI